MKKIITLILIIFLSGCTYTNKNDKNDINTTLKGEYMEGKGCNGFVNEIEIITTCEERNLYLGKIIEISGTIVENECTPDIPQCFSGKQMKNIDSIKVVNF